MRYIGRKDKSILKTLIQFVICLYVFEVDLSVLSIMFHLPIEYKIVNSFCFSQVQTDYLFKLLHGVEPVKHVSRLC